MLLWRKRLRAANTAPELAARYDAARRACELSDWRVERVFLELLQARIRDASSAEFILRHFEGRRDVQKFLAKLILRRAVDPGMVSAVERALFGGHVDWADVDDRVQIAAAQRLARLDRRPRWPWALAATGALAAVLAFFVLRPGTTVAPPAPPVAVREQPPAPEVTRPEPPAPVVAKQEPPAPMAPAVPQEPAPAPLLATRVESATGAWSREAKSSARFQCVWSCSPASTRTCKRFCGGGSGQVENGL
jgi:hypothetical protein